MKRYGNEKTALELTPRAAAIYADSDPLEILERETPDGLRYDLRGVLEADGLTADAVNRTLEELAEECGIVENDGGHIFSADKWESIVELMNDDIREEIVVRGDAETNQAFFSAYAAAHKDACGEEWELNKHNPIW